MNRSFSLRTSLRTALASGLLLGLMALAGASVAHAQTQATDNHNVTITISEMNALSLGGNVDIVLDQVTAGQAPTPQSTSSSYDLTTNSTTSRKITASLGSSYASGITLTVDVTPPSTGSPGGTKTLTTSSKTVVTGISATAESDLNIQYTASADATVPPASYTQTVTYTVVAE